MKYLLLFLPLISYAAEAEFEGGGSSFGNGGHSVVCAKEGKLGRPRSLDLYEGLLESGYSFPTGFDGTAEELALTLAKKIDDALGYRDTTGRHITKNASISSKLKIVSENLSMEDEDLRFTHDSRFQKLSPDCKLVQTINFHQKISVNKALWEQHSVIDQAALLLHESIYWYLRSQGKEADSRRVRKLVAYLMSGGDLVQVIDSKKWNLPSSQVCRSRSRSVFKDTEFYVSVNESGTMEIQFRRLGKYRMLSRTTLIIGAAFSPTTTAIDWENRAGILSGRLNSVSDRDTSVSLRWNQGVNEIQLEGYFEGRYPIDDILVCHRTR